MNWAPVYRRLAEEYGWTPQDVNGMSLRQLFMYVNQSDDVPDASTPPRLRGRDIVSCDTMAEAQEIMKGRNRG